MAAAALAATPAVAGVQPLETVELPPSREQGLDMILIDAEAMPAEPELARELPELEDVSWSGAAIDLLKPIHHTYTDLRRQLARYQNEWGALPQVRVPSGAVLARGSSDPRVAILRERLGLARAGGFDTALQARVTDYQKAHGVQATGNAGPQTLDSLNRGAAWYERLILLNMERARRLPPSDMQGKYILVDAGSARLWMYENGRAVDSMKVIVGTDQSETPMMAALLRYASINPYWNVPPDLVKKLIAPRVLSDGKTYLTDRRYEVLDGWEPDAEVIDPMTVDWKAVAEGKLEPRVRQLPGGANSMGQVKFMMPNEYGIYLHDTPKKELFADDNRWISNGCVRLEDAQRLARWLFGEMPQASSPDREEQVELERPVPVYITYLTVGASPGELTFRTDHYGRDAALLARFGGDGDGMIDAVALTEPLPEAPKAIAKAPAPAVKTPKPPAPAKPAVKTAAAKSAAPKPAASKAASAASLSATKAGGTKAVGTKPASGKAAVKHPAKAKPKPAAKEVAAKPVAKPVAKASAKPADSASAKAKQAKATAKAAEKLAAKAKTAAARP